MKRPNGVRATYDTFFLRALQVLSTQMNRTSWKVEIEIAAQITAIGGHLGSVDEVPTC